MSTLTNNNKKDIIDHKNNVYNCNNQS